MNILVIGGSYFLGRVFTLISQEDDNFHLTLLNRGTYPFNMEHIQELHADRRDRHALSLLPAKEYDVVIDFCGYMPGDIETIFASENIRFRQYIFVSTVDVLKHKTGGLLTESSDYEDVLYEGDAGEYIKNKIILEKELISCCKRTGCAYTIVRPAILYGPFNYAPRESVYIENIVKGNVVPCPYDADGHFQMVYVKDAAVMIKNLCGNNAAYNEIYNICPDEPVTYDLFFEALGSASDLPVNINSMSVRDAQEMHIFLPFPATAEESETYTGSKIVSAAGIGYTSLAEGLERTYIAFKSVYDD